MRNLLAIIVLLFSCSAFAQQYVPFPTNDGAVWRYYTGRSNPLHPSGRTLRQEEQYMTEGDTLIKGLTYKKVMFRRHIYDTLEYYDNILNYKQSTTHLVANVADQYHGAYRQVNKHVYFIGHWDTTEKKLYDFDSVQYFQYWHGIKYLDSVLIGNIYHKAFFDSNNNISVIEGIGWLLSAFPSIATGEEYLLFLCFTNNGTGYMKDSICTYIFPYGTPTGINNAIDKQTTKVYPNPFAEAIHIDAATAGTAILYNSAGIKISEYMLREGENTIATSALSSGIYMMTVKDKSGQITDTRKLVK